MIIYHGTDTKLSVLKSGSYVTKNFKDACKFGYRRAVMKGRPYVFIYSSEIDDDIADDILIHDQKRDRAFIISIPTNVVLYKMYSTYQTPYKLKDFNMS